jgi:DNA repair exonuclease SbcCD ATPase subunit
VVKDASEAHKSLELDRVELVTLTDEFGHVKAEIESTKWAVEANSNYTKLLEKRNKIKDSLADTLARLNRSKNDLQTYKESLKKVDADIELYRSHRVALISNEKLDVIIKKLNQDLHNINVDIKKKNSSILELNGKITVFKSQIEEIKVKIEKAQKVESEYKAYEAYVQCICRDGIPYEVISVTVPEIEREVNNILSQIVEFHTHFEVDGKNVIPYVVYDDRKWIMSLTSGFEKFILSLAIRVALINVSNLPRPNFLVIDEGFGVMDADNLSTMNTLFSYLKSNFEFIMIVSHLDTLRDMVDTHIEIKKENGFSNVKFD